jgi:putative pyruvate formate lyase activating enzyme
MQIKMPNIRSILPQYYQILEENMLPKYLISKYVPATFSPSHPTTALWKQHDTVMTDLKMRDSIPEQSLLDLKVEIARRIFRNCSFCERKCAVDRKKTHGACGVTESKIASEFLHSGEESVLIPSYTIFFSGCTFQCVYCQNWDISQHDCGSYVEPQYVVQLIARRATEGAKNVNWVGGDPTSHLLYILLVLQKCTVPLPQIWNSNMYCSVETMKLLNGVIDVYLTDFKYGNDVCAHRLSKISNYVSVVQRNHRYAYKHGELIVRHLVLPNHIACCSDPILRWIHEYIPESAVNIMPQYHPVYQAEDYEDINRVVHDEEFSQVKERAQQLGLYEI